MVGCVGVPPDGIRVRGRWRVRMPRRHVGVRQGVGGVRMLYREGGRRRCGGPALERVHAGRGNAGHEKPSVRFPAGGRIQRTVPGRRACRQRRSNRRRLGCSPSDAGHERSRQPHQGHSHLEGQGTRPRRGGMEAQFKRARASHGGLRATIEAHHAGTRPPGPRPVHEAPGTPPKPGGRRSVPQARHGGGRRGLRGSQETCPNHHPAAAEQRRRCIALAQTPRTPRHERHHSHAGTGYSQAIHGRPISSRSSQGIVA